MASRWRTKCINNNGTFCVAAPRLTPHRQRQYHEPLDPHEQAQIEERQCLVVQEPFGNGRVFSSFAELQSEHKQFSADRFTKFRVRSSEKADHANKYVRMLNVDLLHLL
jgi:hypothetical protein